MAKVYDTEGNELGNVPISERSQAVLDEGGSLEVSYHTPQLMQGVLGQHSGVFELMMKDDRLITTTPDRLKECLRIQAAVKAARAP